MSIPTQAPPDLKGLTPFLQRANELSKADPVMGYWCLYYAAQLGINAKPKEKASTTLLMSLLDQLEDLKVKLSDNDAATSNEAGSAYIENFALKVFVGADNEDRAGKADRGTARKFLASANFLELLDIFGSTSEDVLEKRKYAKWKAAEIGKAIKEGRKPAPGPPGWDPEEDARQRRAEAEAEAEARRAVSEAKDDDDLLARELAKLTADRPIGGETDASAGQDPSPADSTDGQFATAISPPPGSDSPARSDRRAPARLSFDAGSVLNGTALSPPPAPPATNNKPTTTVPSTPPATTSQAGTDAGAFPISGSASPNFSHPLRPQFEKRGTTSGSSGSGSHSGGDFGAASGTAPHGASTSPSGFLSPADHQQHRLSPAPGEVTIPGRPLPVPPSAGQSGFFAPPQHSQQPQVATSPGLPSAASFPSAPPSNASVITPSAPPAASEPPAPPAAGAAFAAPALPATLPSSLTPSQTAKAQKLAKFAISALDYDDIETASRQLREALAVVEGRDA